MQQIYRRSDEQLEVFTTVFSPQACRTRTRHVETEKVVARMQHRSRWPRELDLDRGDLIQVLFKEDEARWFGRLANGDEGYFPAACVERLQQGEDSSGATPNLLRRGSVPVMARTAGAPCGCTSGRSTPKLLRKSSIQHQFGPNGPGSVVGSPSLLRRVLAKSRRKSCPQLPPHRLDTSSDNSAFQPD